MEFSGKVANGPPMTLKVLEGSSLQWIITQDQWSWVSEHDWLESSRRVLFYRNVALLWFGVFCPCQLIGYKRIMEHDLLVR